MIVRWGGALEEHGPFVPERSDARQMRRGYRFGHSDLKISVVDWRGYFARVDGGESFAQPRWLFSYRGGQHLITAASAAHIDSEPLDFLVERGKRNEKTLGSFGLVPAGALQHINDDAALYLVHDLEQGWLCIVRGGPRTGFAWKRRQ